MIFSSINFIIFWLISLISSKFFNKSLILIFILGLIFYSSQGFVNFLSIFFIASVCVAFLLIKKFFFFFLIILLIPIFSFKYLNNIIFFLKNNFNYLNNLTIIPFFETSIPPGLSFVTFSSIALIFFIKKNLNVKSIELFSFIFYYPHLIAGPIVRPEKLIPQLKNQKLFNFRDLVFGIFIFTIGLFFKVVIADSIADYVNPKFLNPREYSNDELLFSWALFSQQIYYDFNAYTLMAIGVSKTLGINLPENFNSPYLSQSLSEFWKKWHITLSNWIKDFIYIPLGGSRKNFLRNNLNIFISMIISGIWHGSGLNFIFWGALNGIILCIEKIFLIKIYKIFPVFLRTIFIYLLITYLWLFFRVYNTHDIILFHKALLEFNILNIKLIFLFAIIFLFNFFQKYTIIQYLENFFNNKNKLVIFTSSVIFIIFLLMSKTSTERFIYFNF